jgi:hypothetical protein
MKSRLSSQKWIITLVILSMINTTAISDEVPGIWHKGVYKVNTISLANQVRAIWVVFDPDTGRYAHDAQDAEGLLEHFLKQPMNRQRDGIFIHSKTYAIPDTPEERRWMTDYLLKLYRDPKWRKSESDLIENLRRACEKRAIPLYINLSSNLQGKWKVLNDPKKRD